METKCLLIFICLITLTYQNSFGLLQIQENKFILDYKSFKRPNPSTCEAINYDENSFIVLSDIGSIKQIERKTSKVLKEALAKTSTHGICDLTLSIIKQFDTKYIILSGNHLEIFELDSFNRVYLQYNQNRDNETKGFYLKTFFDFSSPNEQGISIVLGVDNSHEVSYSSYFFIFNFGEKSFKRVGSDVFGIYGIKNYNVIDSNEQKTLVYLTAFGSDKEEVKLRVNFTLNLKQIKSFDIDARSFDVFNNYNYQKLLTNNLLLVYSNYENKVVLFNLQNHKYKVFDMNEVASFNTRFVKIDENHFASQDYDDKLNIYSFSSNGEECNFLQTVDLRAFVSKDVFPEIHPIGENEFYTTTNSLGKFYTVFSLNKK